MLVFAADGSGYSLIWSPDAGWGIVKSDNLEIGRFLHLKSEIKKSHIGRSESKPFPDRFDSSLPLGSSNLRFLDFGF
jgi:hypothetical protein